MPSARRPAPLTSAPSSICAAPRAEASSARAAAASGSAARSTSSQRKIAPSVSGRPNSIRAAARRPGAERTASPGPASRSRSCGRGPTVITRAPRRRALRTRSSTIACWLAGSPPTTTTRPARSISPSWADGSARSASSPPPGTPSRCTSAPGRAARASSWARKPSSTVAVGPTRIPTRPARPSTSAAASTASSRLTCRTRPSSWMTGEVRRSGEWLTAYAKRERSESQPSSTS